MKIKISKIISNELNPRVIKSEKFEKLVESIRNFPKMLEVRPIVLSEEMVVLGGHMRLEACRSLGMDEVEVLIAKNLTEKQQKEFLIKDNVSMGDWDWDSLTRTQGDWSREQLDEFGLDVHIFDNLEDDEVEFNPDRGEQSPDESPVRVGVGEEIPKGESERLIEVICPECAHIFNIKL